MSTGRFDYELRANASGFTSEVQKAERSVQQLDKAQKGAAISSKEWKEAGVAAGVAIAAVATTGALALRKVINETSASEKAMAQLNATLKSTGGVSGRTAEDLVKTAKSLQKITTYGDDAIITAQSLLATFKNINKSGDVFDRATRSVLDLSAKMGGDLKGAVLQIGKALENPTKGMTALTRSGVSFTNAQKDVITALQDSGRLIEAQNMLLKEVETQFEGSARAARENFRGALEALSITWGDLFEAQENASKSMTDAINGLNDALADPELKSNLDYLIDKFAQWTSSAVNGMSGFVTVVREANSPLTELNEKINETAAALKRAENTGFWREAKKQQAILDGLRKEYDRVSNSIKNGDKIIASLMPKLPEVTKAVKEQTAAIYDGEKAVKAINDAQKVWDARLKYAQVLIKNTSDELDELSDAAKESAKAQEEAAKDTARYWDDVRSTLSGMFFEMAADGQNAFDVLVNGFKGMIAKMLAEAAANRILLAVGVGASGSAAAGTAGAAGGAGGIGNLFSAASTGYSWLKGGGIGGAVQGGFNALATGYEGVAQFASQQGWHGVAGAAQTSAGQYAGGLGASAVNLGLNVGAGMLGSYAGQQVFQNKGSTGIGSAGGAIVGSIWGPIGTAVGAFVGEGIEKAFASAFGYSGQKKNRASIGFDTATDYAAPLGGKHDKDNLRNANTLYGVINEMADLLGGELSGTIRVSNRDGVEISGLGKFKSSADAFNAVLKELIKSSDTIAESMKPLILGFKGTAEEVSRFAIAVSSINSMAGINTVTNAIKDFAVTLPNATESYKLHTDALQEQIRAFDGSLSAAESLNTVLYENKTAAYQFAMSIQSIGRSISDSALGQAQSIRESVLTPQQLLDRRYDQRDSLAASLLTEKDPERAAATAQRLLEVNQQIFNSITDDQQLLFAENFAKVAEDTNNVAQYILDQSLKGLQTTQDEINKQVADMLNSAASKQQQAADTQLQAANTMLEASYRYIKGNQVAV